MSRHYKLAEDGRTPVKVTFMEFLDWQVANQDLLQVRHSQIGNYDVSTVFLGLNHNWRREGPPVLWETMVFGGRLDARMQSRYTSYEDALKGHEAILAAIRKAALG